MRKNKAYKNVSMTLDLTAFATLVYLKNTYKLGYAEITNALLTTVSGKHAEIALGRISEARSLCIAHKHNTKEGAFHVDQELLIEPYCLSSDALAELLGKASTYGLINDEDNYLIF
ncbi:MAG: hypothetical protein ACI9YE_003287 [Psychroserpens sp.]|jgi:hypothetical protein